MHSAKHRLSPAPLPPKKRLHTIFYQSHEENATPSFESSLYDELILAIFSHLSFVDLCAIQPVSKNWYRLAADNELWRTLYLAVYGRSRLRGARGFIGRSDGRQVKPLPGRIKGEDFKDWKRMFRISSNWKKGRCSVEQLSDTVQRTFHTDGSKPHHNIHILVAGSLTITASSQPSERPTIHLYDSSGAEHILVCEPKYNDIASQITALAIDQSPPSFGHLRLAFFLKTGEFSVFSIHTTHLFTSTRKYTYFPVRRIMRSSPIIQAVYHHPLLITLSQTFSLSIYDLSSDDVAHTQTLTSFTSFPPTSLVLSTPSPSTYKLVLAYAIPVYPAHWSVGATELIISGPTTSFCYSASSSPPLSSSSKGLSHVHPESMTVTATRTTRALDVPPGWIDEHKLRSMRDQWNRKVARIADTQTDGKWVVVAPGIPLVPPVQQDNLLSPMTTTTSMAASVDSTSSADALHSPTSLQLYRLSLPSLTSSVASTPPKLTFVRNLDGQRGPVSVLALADGRCVSLGLNGSMWVWDLEGGTGAEVVIAGLKSSIKSVETYNHDATKDTVAFDDRRIITAEAGRVVIRSFDI